MGSAENTIKPRIRDRVLYLDSASANTEEVVRLLREHTVRQIYLDAPKIGATALAAFVSKLRNVVHSVQGLSEPLVVGMVPDSVEPAIERLFTSRLIRESTLPFEQYCDNLKQNRDSRKQGRAR